MKPMPTSSSPKTMVSPCKTQTTPATLPLSSLLVPVFSILIALVAPVFILGLLTLDAEVFCSRHPTICSTLHLADQIEDFEQGHRQEISSVVSLEFFNRLEIPVDTYWKDYSGEEQLWFRMDPFSFTGNISSIRGHVWSFRNGINNELLFEEAIEADHCGKIHIAQPEHLEALRQYCSSTGRAVIGNWPRAPLVRFVPRASKLGSTRKFITENAQFETYEGRMKSTIKELTVKTISTRPHMLQIDDFLSDEECDFLMETSSMRLADSGPADSASSTWLEHKDSPIVAAVTQRVFEFMEFDSDVETHYFAEKIQVSRFQPGQEYLPHFDAMDFTTSQRSMPHNRFATVMLYLNSVEETDGGSDVWPRANNANEFAHAPCDSEFKVQPKRGTLIVLYNMFGDGNIDEAALHGSCPVTNMEKEKWTANMFFWDPFVQWSV